jgi:hypothetical protein
VDRETLKRHLAEGLSLAQIGRLVDRHPSTVAYWLRKHGLTAAHRDRFAPKGGIPRETLAPLVESGLSIRDIAAALAVGYSTVRYWLRRHGLSTARARRHDIPAERPSRVRLECRRHGWTDFVKRTDGAHYRCLKCRSEQVTAQRRRLKLKLVEEAGGRCVLCGYDRYPGALQFHHVDPAAKAFGLSRDGFYRSLSRARVEAQKCALLCANCHAEVEGGLIALPAADGSDPG